LRKATGKQVFAGLEQRIILVFCWDVRISTSAGTFSGTVRAVPKGLFKVLNQYLGSENPHSR
jgi:hypothetical protein